MESLTIERDVVGKRHWSAGKPQQSLTRSPHMPQTLSSIIPPRRCSIPPVAATLPEGRDMHSSRNRQAHLCGQQPITHRSMLLAQGDAVSSRDGDLLLTLRGGVGVGPVGTDGRRGEQSCRAGGLTWRGAGHECGKARNHG
ncbi:hypothetical protein G7046_g7913 [Stylonectria norvegica]|nr:hypothetical protein G7046_g7913 [Stylonectria norvegica]